MPQPPIDRARRRILLGAGSMWATALSSAFAPPTSAQPVAAPPVAADHGRVLPPVPMPALSLWCADGTRATLAGLVQGRATALHLMFAGCSSICPIQGAIFERLQTLLPDQRECRIQLLSLSIDPIGDTPAAMQAWLARFHAREGWMAATPRVEDLDRLLALMGQGRNAVESHTTQVSIIDRRGELVFRTEPLPSAESLAALLRQA